MKDYERKIRSIQNQRINQFITNLSKKLVTEAGMQDLKKDHSSKEKEEEKLNLEFEMKKNKDPTTISFLTKYYYILREFLLCFTYSLFPTWYIELYIDEQTDKYKEIVEIIRKKPTTGDPEEKKNQKEQEMTNLDSKLAQMSEDLKNENNENNENKDNVNKDNNDPEKKNIEEIKDEDSIDPTDNINPENYKLIQKLQNLHKIEILKETMNMGKNNDNDQDGSSNEETSKNTDPVHDIDYRKDDIEVENKKRSSSFE